MKKWSLQMRITCFIGMILVLACLLLTYRSILSATAYYNWIERMGKSMMQSGMDIRLIIMPEFVSFRQFSARSIGVMLLTIVVGLVFTYWATGRLLRPLIKLTAAIRQVDEGSLHHRVELPDATGETLQLTNSFNNMLVRLEDSFTVQKNFAANAAHELKTPLAVIKTSLQVLNLDEEPTPEDYRAFAQSTGIALDRLINTVDKLLALTNASAAGAESDVCLTELLDQITSDLSIRAREKQLKISVAGDAVSVRSDRTLLYRAFSNLVENSIKYNHEKGSVEIFIRDSGEQVQVEIVDTGIGIPAVDIPHIFEPLYRADRSRSQKISGSGLGLAIVKLIIERYHGSILVESEAEHGTRMVVLLPRSHQTTNSGHGHV